MKVAGRVSLRRRSAEPSDSHVLPGAAFGSRGLTGRSILTADVCLRALNLCYRADADRQVNCVSQDARHFSPCYNFAALTDDRRSTPAANLVTRWGWVCVGRLVQRGHRYSVEIDRSSGSSNPSERPQSDSYWKAASASSGALGEGLVENDK